MRYLKHFGMIFYDTTGDNGPGQNLYNVLTLVLSVGSMIMVSSVLHEFDDHSQQTFSLISAVACSSVSFATIGSTAIALYNMRRGHRKFKNTLEGFEIYTPASAASLHRIGRLLFFVIAVYVTAILPVNVVKLCNIFNNHARPVLMTSYFLLHYAENFYLCCTEMHFVAQCLVVCSKFRGVNDDLRRLSVGRDGDSNAYKYFGLVGYETRRAAAAVSKSDKDNKDDAFSRAVAYERDFYRPKDKGYALANTVELLRINHWLAREAVKDLNDMFGVRIGLSMFYLIVVTLFDVYAEVFHAYKQSNIDVIFRTSWMFIVWMVQYSFRFIMVIITANVATKQAVETKKLVSEMNSRYLDISTREELQIFHNQLCIDSVQFTLFNIFSINNSLFCSVVNILATYTVMLVQSYAKKKY